MASPLDTATAIANRKKQVLDNAIPAPTGSTTPPGFKFTPMETPAAKALGQSIMNATSTTPPGFNFTPMVTPAAQALGQRIMGTDNHVVSATEAPAAAAPAATGLPHPAAAAADPTGFDYSGMVRSPAQIEAEARARASMQIDTRAAAIADALARYKATAEEQRKGQLTNLAGMQEGNRYQFAGSNLGTSGFMAGANAVAQGATTDNIGQINKGEQQATETTGNQLADLEKLRGSVTTATMAELERLNNDVQFKGADLASVLANRSFDLQRGKALLGGELTGQDLANQGAAIGVERSRGLLPYDLGNAATNYERNKDLLPFDVAGAQLTNEGRSISNQTGAQQLDTATKMQPYTLEGARLGNERAAQVNRMGELEYIIANDPDVGKRAQAQVEMQQARKQIEQMDAQIKASTAKALTGGSSGGFTAWQQYQMIRDQKGDGEKGAADSAKAQVRLADSFRTDYNISQPAADLWANFMDIATTPKSDGTTASREELSQLLGNMLKNPGIQPADKGWANAMFFSGQGEQWAQTDLNKWRKPSKSATGTQKPPQP